MAFEKRVILAGSDNVQRPGLDAAGALDSNRTIHASVILRRKRPLPASAMQAGSGRFLSHAEMEEAHGADPSEIEKVEEFAHEAGLSVVDSSTLKRRVTLSGTAQQMEAAFGAKLIQYRSEKTGGEYRGRTGTISIPSELKDSVLAVLGLDARPVAEPHSRMRQSSAGSFTPLQVASLYNFPGQLTGKGQTIAIIELGGGYRPADLTAYFKSLGLKTPKMTAISVDGGKNTPGGDADGEVMLDIEVAGAIASEASIAVYFAPNTDAGFVNAISNAAHDTARKPSVISISWGASEDNWSEQSRNAMNSVLQDAAALGVTVTAAAGDNGSTDGSGDRKLHVDFPSSSPFALACGGTTLKGSGNKITSETVWNEVANQAGATGGGISNAFPLPQYQQAAKVPKQPQTNFAGRGVPDISGNADPLTGYQVRVNGQNVVVGGTSAVSPLWAALVAQFNQQLGRPVGFLNPKLYSAQKGALRDITSGNNDDGNLGFYKAQNGWDACTGLGTPDGVALLQMLSSSSSDRTEVTGSQLQHNPDAKWTDLANPASQDMTATILLRRSGEDIGDKLLSGAEPVLQHGDSSASTVAAPEDVSAVCSFAEGHGLRVIESSPATRTVKVEGTAEQIASAFCVQLGVVHGESGEHLTYQGAISLPHALAERVTAVLGLDQRPIARHHTHTA